MTSHQRLYSSLLTLSRDIFLMRTTNVEFFSKLKNWLNLVPLYSLSLQNAVSAALLWFLLHSK